MTNAKGYIATVIYDASGRAVASINALGYRTTYVYDADQDLTCRKYDDGL